MYLTYADDRHNKSRSGCKTCKARHLRCDETFPQCQTCTRHKARCPYNDVEPEETDAVASNKLHCSPQDESPSSCLSGGITEDTERLFYMFDPMPDVATWPSEDRRLIARLGNIYNQSVDKKSVDFYQWTRHIPALLAAAATCPFAMDALLAFLAVRVSPITDCLQVDRIAMQHRSKSLRGLHDALFSFSPESSDSILATSLLLSWEASDWHSCMQLMQGLSTVIEAMAPWRPQSRLSNFISEFASLSTPAYLPTELYFGQAGRFQAIQNALTQVQKLGMHLKAGRLAAKVRLLIQLLDSLVFTGPQLSVEQLFDHLSPLRAWLFEVPIENVQSSTSDFDSLLVVAYLYAVAMQLEVLFPELQFALGGSLCLKPMQNIMDFIASKLLSNGFAGDTETLRLLLQFPASTLDNFGTCRRDWQRLLRPTQPTRYMSREKWPLLQINQVSMQRFKPYEDYSTTTGNIAPLNAQHGMKQCASALHPPKSSPYGHDIPNNLDSGLSSVMTEYSIIHTDQLRYQGPGLTVDKTDESTVSCSPTMEPKATPDKADALEKRTPTWATAGAISSRGALGVREDEAVGLALPLMGPLNTYELPRETHLQPISPHNNCQLDDLLRYEYQAFNATVEETGESCVHLPIIRLGTPVDDAN